MSDAVKSLGVILDPQLTLDRHVAAVSKACYFHIRALRHIRKSLPDDVAKMVACSIVSSRLDYCNSLYAGMSDSNFAKLQRVQNCLARVVTGTARSDHITPVLAELHWLPIKSRVTYKIASLTHNIRRAGQPAYLAELLSAYKPTRELRSSSQDLLVVNRTKKCKGTRAFSWTAASVWNSLPLIIRQCEPTLTFHKNLKTYLYTKHFVS